GLKYAQQHGDARYIMDTYNDIAVNYFSLNDYKNALKNYDTLLKKSIKINDNYRQSIALQGIADIYINQAKTMQAITLLQRAVMITDTSDYRNLKKVYNSLSAVYAKTGDYKNAYESSMKYKRFSDSVASKEKTDKLTGITHQLEFENKQALLKATQDKQLAIQESEIERQKVYRNVTFAGLFIFIILAVFLFIRFREKRKLNITLQTTLSDLKSMQSQLIQSEKMASLGELTAGISHEIQNPLNFVTNFSEVSNELIDEMKIELSKGNYEEVNTIVEDVKKNLEKINYHGKRADAIVKGMLQHSRKNSGVKESTDINKLADEYLRLSYHGLRAKDKSFNATIPIAIGTDFDDSIGKIKIVQQDIGRVLLNLYNNAFYAVNEKIKFADKNYQPTVSIQTKKINDKVEIKITDNGKGIPQNIVDKIFQPFFTTKPTGQGTGLGLSLSYDIIKAHGGEIIVESIENEGTTFIINLPTV
ncbi:MAG: ATP-binding protein, partial [Chitinophagaceae bacterium]